MPSPSATAQTSVEVSSASICIARILPEPRAANAVGCGRCGIRAFGTIVLLPTVFFRAAPSFTAAVMDTVVISALDQEGRGVARVDGKAMFVEGALIGERVAVDVLRRKPNYELARMSELLAASPARTPPLCPYFGVCGGCSLQ